MGKRHKIENPERIEGNCSNCAASNTIVDTKYDLCCNCYYEFMKEEEPVYQDPEPADARGIVDFEVEHWGFADAYMYD